MPQALQTQVLVLWNFTLPLPSWMLLPPGCCQAWFVQMVLKKPFYQLKSLGMGSGFPGELFGNTALPIYEAIQSPLLQFRVKDIFLMPLDPDQRLLGPVKKVVLHVRLKDGYMETRVHLG